MRTKLSVACDAAADELSERGVPERVWSCGRVADDRIYLTFDEDVWEVGYAERGDTTVYLRTKESNQALDRFVREAERAWSAVNRHVTFGDAD